MKADWVAIGTSKTSLMVAAVVHTGERTTTLPQFASFIADVARIHQLGDATVINLDGACAAQIYIPALTAYFGCKSASTTPNRIFLWGKNE